MGRRGCCWLHLDLQQTTFVPGPQGTDSFHYSMSSSLRLGDQRQPMRRQADLRETRQERTKYLGILGHRAAELRLIERDQEGSAVYCSPFSLTALECHHPANSFMMSLFFKKNKNLRFTLPPRPLDALDWIWEARDQHGLYIHPCLAFIHNRASGYGIASGTGTRLKEGTVVARIPKTCIMSPRTTHVPLRAILETVEWPAIVKLALVFLYEFWLKKASRFAGYNAIFYGKEGELVVPDVPRLWSNEDKTYLAGTEIEDRREDSDVCSSPDI